MRGSARRFVSVSARRLPGRSGIRSRRSSRMRTKPAGSPRGETSRPPSGRHVATQANGERSMSCRVRLFRRSATFAAMSAFGEPRIPRGSVSVEIVLMLRV